MVIAEERNVSVSPVRFAKIQQNAFVWLQKRGHQTKEKQRSPCLFLLCCVYPNHSGSGYYSTRNSSVNLCNCDLIAMGQNVKCICAEIGFDDLAEWLSYFCEALRSW